MRWNVYFAHAEGEDDIVEKLAAPIREAGYDVAHRGTVMVGESVQEEASKILSTGCPVVLCGTIRAIGTSWARRVVNSARMYPGVRIFAAQMDRDADVQTLALDERVADYWQDPSRAVQALLDSIQKHYPIAASSAATPLTLDSERRYRELALNACDIIDLANLPEDRHVATRQLELRRLYVPLRVRVEAASQTEVSEDQIDAIERRREIKRRSRAAWTPEDRVGRAPVGERLASARRLVILGEPGAGKSTMLRWIATAYLLRLKQDPDLKDLPDVATLPNEDWLPVMIRCRDLDASCGSFDDILRRILRKSELKEAESNALRTSLAARTSEGSALLLVDGLDEISDPIGRASFCRQIETICLANPKVPIIVTSRIVGYREMGYRIGRGFEHVTVADLSPEDKDDFARRWCNLTQPYDRRETATADLIKDIHSSDRIERLTGNPMLLTTMALVKRKVGKLPRRRVDLYWEAFQVLLNFRSEVDQPIDYREALPQFEYVAYAMCQDGNQQLRDEEITVLFERMRDEYPKIHAARAHGTEEFLRLLERRTGILVQSGQVRYRGKSVPVYEFRHLTFQEFLAALALIDGRYPGRDTGRTLAQNVALLAGRTETKIDLEGNQTTVVSEGWREALRLCVASCKDDEVDDVMSAILNPLPEEQAELTARSRAILAVLCLADEPNVSEELARSLLQKLAAQLSPDLEFGDDEILDAFKELAASRWAQLMAEVLLQECRRFVTEEDPRALQAALVGSYVGYSTRSWEQTIVGDWLVDWASRELSDEDSAIKDLFFLFAFNLESKTPFPFFASIPNLSKKMFSAMELGTQATFAAVLALVAAQEEDVWKPSLAEMQSLLTMASKPFCNSLVLGMAGYILGLQRYSPALPLLISILNHRLPVIRQMTAEALGKMEDASAAEPLLGRMDDPDKKVRQEAIQALGMLNYEHPFQPVRDHRAMEPLLARLRDPEVAVRRTSVETLGKMRYVGAVDELLSVFQNDQEDETVRREAAEALGKIGDERALEPLVQGLRHPEHAMQLAAEKGLAAMGSSVIPFLLPLIGEEFKVSYRAEGALAKIGAPAVDPLIEILESHSDEKCQGAARALGRIKDARAVPALIAKLAEPNLLVRWYAAEALGEIGGSEALAALRPQLSSGDSYISTAFLKASLPNLDASDRKLLTRNADEATLFDIEEEIGQARISEASVKLGIPIEMVRQRFEELATQFPLKLSWQQTANQQTNGRPTSPIAT